MLFVIDCDFCTSVILPVNSDCCTHTHTHICEISVLHSESFLVRESCENLPTKSLPNSFFTNLFVNACNISCIKMLKINSCGRETLKKTYWSFIWHLVTCEGHIRGFSRFQLTAGICIYWELTELTVIQSIGTFKNHCVCPMCLTITITAISACKLYRLHIKASID